MNKLVHDPAWTDGDGYAIEKLRALEKAASASRWTYTTGYGVATIGTEHKSKYIAHAVDYLEIKDADMICAARNLLPVFLELYEVATDIFETGSMEILEKRLNSATAKLEAAIAKEMGE